MAVPIDQQPKGIDVSHWQGVINWQQVRRLGGIDFAYIKATEGTYYTDPSYAQNVRQARQAGVIPGAYHFLSHRPELTGAMQARYFYDVIKGDLVPGTLPPALDIEEDPSYPTPDTVSHMTARVVQFVGTLHALCGQYPVIYGDRSFLTHAVNPGPIAATCPLWIAHWGVSRPNLYSVDGKYLPWTYHTFHQYEARPNFAASVVPGVAGTCDVDRFNGSIDRLHVLAGME